MPRCVRFTWRTASCPQTEGPPPPDPPSTHLVRRPAGERRKPSGESGRDRSLAIRLRSLCVDLAHGPRRPHAPGRVTSLSVFEGSRAGEGNDARTPSRSEAGRDCHTGLPSKRSNAATSDAWFQRSCRPSRKWKTPTTSAQWDPILTADQLLSATTWSSVPRTSCSRSWSLPSSRRRSKNRKSASRPWMSPAIGPEPGICQTTSSSIRAARASRSPARNVRGTPIRRDIRMVHAMDIISRLAAGGSLRPCCATLEHVETRLNR